MGNENKIQIVSEYTDLSSAKIKASFEKSEKSAKDFGLEIERMRKSMQRSMNKSRKEMKAGLNGISSAMKKTEVHTKRVSKATQRMSFNMKDLRRKVGSARNILLLFYFVYLPIIKVFKSLTEAMIRQEDAIKRLNVALEIQGTFTKTASKDLQELASSFQDVTRYGDETVLEVMQKLVSVGGLLPSQLQGATQATLDFATATGRDLTSAANIMSKAAAGYTGELSRYGIIIDNSIPKSKKFAEVLRFMNQRFGGAAQRDIENYAGQVKQLGNIFGDLKENISKNMLANSNFIKHVKLWTDLLKGLRHITKPAGETTFLEEIEKQIGIVNSRLPLLEKQLDRQTEIQRKFHVPISKQLIAAVEESRKKRLELNLLLRQEVELSQKSAVAERAKTMELEKVAIIKKREDELDAQSKKVKLQFEKSFAMQSMQVWEDLFFNVMTGKFREMEDVVISFGNTVLKMLIRLGIQKAFINFGWGEIIGASGGTGAHSGGVMRHGQSSSYGVKRTKFHDGGEVRATLLAGEGVVNRKGMQNLGVDNLNKLNRGQGGGGGETINNYYIQTIDERSFRDRLEQNGDIYSGAISSDLPANREVRRSIQRFGR